MLDEMKKLLEDTRLRDHQRMGFEAALEGIVKAIESVEEQAESVNDLLAIQRRDMYLYGPKVTSLYSGAQIREYICETEDAVGYHWWHEFESLEMLLNDMKNYFENRGAEFTYTVHLKGDLYEKVKRVAELQSQLRGHSVSMQEVLLESASRFCTVDTITDFEEDVENSLL